MPEETLPADKGLAARERVAWQGMRVVIDSLEHYKALGFEYRVVGGTALGAFTNNGYSPVRTNGTVRDIDIIVMSDPEKVLPALKKELNDHSGDTRLPPVEFNVVPEHGELSPLQMLGGFKKLRVVDMHFRFVKYWYLYQINYCGWNVHD